MVVGEIVDDVCTPKEEVAERIIAPGCGCDAKRAAVSGNRISIALNNAISVCLVRRMHSRHICNERINMVLEFQTHIFENVKFPGVRLPT
jgi:hypothetical protein